MLVKKEKTTKPILTLSVTLLADVYSIPYGRQDLENVINLFNEMHAPRMVIAIKSCKPLKPPKIPPLK